MIRSPPRACGDDNLFLYSHGLGKNGRINFYFFKNTYRKR